MAVAFMTVPIMPTEPALDASLGLPCRDRRQQLSPPTTSASSPPACLASLISVARAAVASGGTPKPPGPARNSPESLISARFNLSVAYRDAGEAAELDVLAQRRGGLLDEFANRLLVVLDVRLVQQHDIGEELPEAPLDDLLGDGLRLAFLEGLLAQRLALGGHDVLRHVLATEVLRVRHGDVHGQVLGQLAEGLVASHEVGLAVHLDQDGELPVVVDVGADVALVGGAVRLLVGLRDATLAQQRGGLVDVAVCVLEGALDVHEARAGHGAQCLDLLGRYSHGVTSTSSLALAEAPQGAPRGFFRLRTQRARPTHSAAVVCTCSSVSSPAASLASAAGSTSA